MAIDCIGFNVEKSLWFGFVLTLFETSCNSWFTCPHLVVDVISYLLTSQWNVLVARMWDYPLETVICITCVTIHASWGLVGRQYTVEPRASSKDRSSAWNQEANHIRDIFSSPGTCSIMALHCEYQTSTEESFSWAMIIEIKLVRADSETNSTHLIIYCLQSSIYGVRLLLDI